MFQTIQWQVDRFMETFIKIMLFLPILLFVMPGQNNWSEELPRIVIWYLVFGSSYLLFF
jgi:hypothetical protein